MEPPEPAASGAVLTCSKCGSECREAKKFCPRCGFPFASVFRQPTAKLQSLEPAIKASAMLFGINLLFLIQKITPKSAHLAIEAVVELLFALVVIQAVYPFRAKMRYLCRRFFNRPYPPLAMVALALLTAAVLHSYFLAIQSMGFRMARFLEAGDIGTLKVAWVFFSAAVLAPVFEEIYFRGYLFGKFRLVLAPREAVILQGLVFGIIHLTPAAYFSHTLMGILFGYFRYRTRSLLPGILCHALWNLSVIASEYWRLTLG